MFNIASMTLKEMVRRRILLVTLTLTVNKITEGITRGLNRFKLPRWITISQAIVHG